MSRALRRPGSPSARSPSARSPAARSPGWVADFLAAASQNLALHALTHQARRDAGVGFVCRCAAPARCRFVASLRADLLAIGRLRKRKAIPFRVRYRALLRLTCIQQSAALEPSPHIDALLGPGWRQLELQSVGDEIQLVVAPLPASAPYGDIGADVEALLEGVRDPPTLSVAAADAELLAAAGARRF